MENKSYNKLFKNIMLVAATLILAVLFTVVLLKSMSSSKVAGDIIKDTTEGAATVYTETPEALAETSAETEATTVKPVETTTAKPSETTVQVETTTAKPSETTVQIETTTASEEKPEEKEVLEDLILGGVSGGKTVAEIKHGTITDVDAEGKIKATMDGEEVDATYYKWAFLYKDFEGNLHCAGNSTAVSMMNNSGVLLSVSAAEDKYKKAVIDYERTIELGASAETRAKYKALADEAKTALEEAQSAAVAAYLNGKFWGGANSPAYNYITSYKYTYQGNPEPITFSYILVDGIYCVLVYTFFE